MGVRLLRHGADIGQAVSGASWCGRGGMCGREGREGARNSGQDAGDGARREHSGLGAGVLAMGGGRRGSE